MFPLVIQRLSVLIIPLARCAQRLRGRDAAMQRRDFLSRFALVSGGVFAVQWGCRGSQVARVMSSNESDMVGSHAAGAETWKPLIAESTSKLIGRQQTVIQAVSHDGTPMSLPAAKKRICFVGVENKSAEEIGDFREQLYELVDTVINESQTFEVINRRFVESGLQECRLRPEDLFVPNSRRTFTAAMEKLEQPFDYLLFAKITSGTTESNKDYQRNYLLTLELVNVETGATDKESAELRKGYFKSALGKLKNRG